MKRCSPSLVTREMQIQTMRYNSTSIIIIIKKSTNNKCWRGCREKGPAYIVGGNVNGAVTMENGREVSLKKKKNSYNKIQQYDSTPRCISEKDKNSNSKRSMYPSAHSSPIYNN